MPRKIEKLRVVESIKPGPYSTILPDGTITNPVPYVAVEVVSNDGAVVQIECDPEQLTHKMIADALDAYPNHSVGEVSEGDEV